MNSETHNTSSLFNRVLVLVVFSFLGGFWFTRAIESGRTEYLVVTGVYLLFIASRLIKLRREFFKETTVQSVVS